MSTTPELDAVLKVLEETIPECRVERTGAGITIHIGDEGARALEALESGDIPWLKVVLANIKLVRTRARGEDKKRGS